MISIVYKHLVENILFSSFSQMVLSPGLNLSNGLLWLKSMLDNDWILVKLEKL